MNHDAGLIAKPSQDYQPLERLPVMQEVASSSPADPATSAMATVIPKDAEFAVALPDLLADESRVETWVNSLLMPRTRFIL